MRGEGAFTSRAMKADVAGAVVERSVGENFAHPSWIVTVALIFATDGQLIAIFSRVFRECEIALMTREEWERRQTFPRKIRRLGQTNA